ncbi:MAG TPA: hypothetical protein VH144_03820 [Candidatus Saccharimonadales bacterium]|nr:hypothetical protein [Candidatus Saccharimonadales bacterium]
MKQKDDTTVVYREKSPRAPSATRDFIIGSVQVTIALLVIGAAFLWPHSATVWVPLVIGLAVAAIGLDRLHEGFARKQKNH